MANLLEHSERVTSATLSKEARLVEGVAIVRVDRLKGAGPLTGVVNSDSEGENLPID
eukprot:CAMPEP_0170129684 /NCGR_PEP_ID=MMETSP0020_2-20130122/22045_1 /TAXON_ID=98059 /ORGANISM="Dinobryon sp., Strain UTEXLB2267" /LENGTH=56 /DNA_ID=CAMNT_0010364107 /DNA_START=109 /DNA_END=279 /DNA_ORIENTATION=+